MLRIRQAERDDLPIIMRFIRELAAYEKLEDEITFDEARLAEECFGERPVAHTLIAEWSGEPAGFLLYFYNFSTFLGKRGIYVEDLYVSPELRGNKIGLSLLQYVAAIAKAQDCGRVEWSVLDWNEPSIAFYESLGAKAKKEWLGYQLSGDALSQLAASADHAMADA